jgi:chemotaxis protein MotB
MALRRHRRDDLEGELNKGALWAVTYGDLMSYLMIFFLLMFAFSTKNSAVSNHEQQQADDVQESLASIQSVFGGRPDEKLKEKKIQRKKEDAVAQNLQQVVDQQKMGNLIQINATEEKVRLVLKEAVVFDSGSADLKSKATPILSEIASEIAKLSNPVVIEGHTDNVPIHHGRYASNWELSMARAYAVIHFFETHGIDPSRLAGIGYGEHHPLAENSTPEGRMQNRRIGIELLRRGNKGAGSPETAPALTPPAALDK